MEEKFMTEALLEAKEAYADGEVPVGCVVVCDGKIIARGHNRKIQNNDSLAHAEMLCLNEAQKVLNTKYLYDCTMYLTLEPCAMCAGAMINTRLGELVFGTREPKSGCCGSNYDLLRDNRFNHAVKVTEGVMREECSHILSAFFEERRKNKC